MPKCCNPFHIGHSKKQNEKSKKISDFDRCRTLFPNFAWEEGQYLCMRCRLRMTKEHEQLKVLKKGVELGKRKRVEAENSGSSSGNEGGDDRAPAMDDDDANNRNLDNQDNQEDQPTPSAPSVSNLYPILPEEPCSSSQAIAKQLPYNPAVPTPTGGSLAGSSTDSGKSKSSQSSPDESELVKQSLDLNRTLQDDILSPVLPSDISKPSRLRKKIEHLKQRASDAVLSITGLKASPAPRKGKDCVFCNKLLHELSEKFKIQDTKIDKYKVLTCIPNRFTVPEVQDHTGCTEYMARKAQTLKNIKGHFSWPPPKQGKPIDPLDEEAIIKFYNQNDNSRASPSETIMVKINGNREPVGKRYILHNLNDLYQVFKIEHPNIKVSISKFQKLRPRNCVWPGLKGFHITCVCEQHQNFEFQLEAIDCELQVSEFVKKFVCENDGELREECHTGMCGDCPKAEFLEKVLEKALKEEAISYTQWVRTDSTEIKNITINIDDFKGMFYANVPRIVEHEFVTRRQSSFIKSLRDQKIKESACITIQVDFAQNYSFVVQNAVQGFHWNNKQATVHPFVVHHWNSENEQVVYKTYCVISDEMTHDADTFHVFRNAVMPLIKRDLEGILIQKVYYVSDGCGGQYKNVKNFANLMLHHEDYGLEAEWHFCSTSHGKGTCDGISAVVKCSTRRESLVKGIFITEPDHMMNFCKGRLTSPTLEFVFVSKNEVATQRPLLADRYKPFKTIKGTRKHHAFIPKKNGIMSMGRTSTSELFTDIDFKHVEVCDFTSCNVEIGSYYAFFEGGNYHVGMLVDEDGEEGDIKLQVLKINRRSRVASWPDPLIFTDVAYRDVLMKLKDPETNDGKVYLLDKEDMPNMKARYNLRKAKLTSQQ